MIPIDKKGIFEELQTEGGDKKVSHILGVRPYSSKGISKEEMDGILSKEIPKEKMEEIPSKRHFFMSSFRGVSR